jgi:uncharacterized protein (DUF1499 family)
MGRIGKILLTTTTIILVGILVFIIAVRSFKPPLPANLGVRDGRLAPCPETPNCISTQSTTPEHQMAPLPFTGSTDTALERLRQIIRETPRAAVVDQQPGYIRAEFRSRVFDFVDDVEFYVDEAAGVVHFRAAARLGRSDMGVNRTRIETIGTAFRAN